MIKKKISIGFLLVMASIQAVTANLLHPLEPIFLQELEMPDYMFGVIFAAMALTNFLFSPFWGRLTGSLGEIKVLTFCFIGYGAGQAVFGMVSSKIGLILARMLSGIFIGGLSVSILSYIMTYSPSPEAREKNLVTYATLNAVFTPFGYLVGGYLGDWSIPATFVIQAIGLAGIGVAIGTFLKDNHEAGEKIQFVRVFKEANPIKAFAMLGGALPAYIAVFLVICSLTSFGQTCFDQSFNYYIRDVFSFASSSSGLVKAAIGVITFIVNSTLCLAIMRKYDKRSALCGIYGAMALTTVAVIIFTDATPYVISGIIYYAVYAMALPLIQSNLADIRNRTDQTIIGLYNSFRAAGMVCGSLFAGVIYSIGQKLPFFSAGISFVIITVLTYFYGKLSRKSMSAEAQQTKI